MSKYFYSVIILVSFCCSLLAEEKQQDDAWLNELRRQAEQGDIPAQLRMGMVCDAMGDQVTAAAWYLKAAEAGNPAAMFELGHRYIQGAGVTIDDEMKFKWFLKAANRGHTNAMHNVGVAYSTGEGVTQSDKAAFEWFLKAAELGSFEDMHLVGDAYRTGSGVPQKEMTAFKWYMKAAEKDYALSMGNVGQYYASGEGVQKSYKSAFEWFLKAAENGDLLGMINVGVCYQRGEGIDRDDRAALRWHLKASEKGSPIAMSNAGELYMQGRGAPENFVQAYAWINVSGACGHDVSDLRTRLKQLMTASQIEEAQKLSAEIFERVGCKDPWIKQKKEHKAGLNTVRVRSKYPDVQEIIEKAGEGDTYSQSVLAILCYSSYKDLGWDLDAAYYYGEKARAANQPLGAFVVGSLLAQAAVHGFSKEERVKEAKKVLKSCHQDLRALAVQDNVYAQYAMYGIHTDERAGMADRKLARNYLKQAAANRYGPALSALGLKIYFDAMLSFVGPGMSQEEKTQQFSHANVYLSAAEAEGQVLGSMELGILGDTSRQNDSPTIAADYYWRAAKIDLADNHRNSALQMLEKLKELRATRLANDLERRIYGDSH